MSSGVPKADAAVLAAVVSNHVALFGLFVNGGGVEYHNERIQEASALVTHQGFSRAPLSHRVAFLRARGFSREEIEAAFDAAGNHRDYEAVLGMSDISSINFASSPSDAVPRGMAPENKPTATLSVAEGFWRIGATVFAYKGNMSYYPVPLLGIDMNRAEDVIKIAHQLESGQYGEPTFLPPGFKGVIPDEFPTYEAVRTSMTVIAKDPDIDGKERFREAVIVGVGPCNADGDFVVDIEWCHTSTRQHNLDYRSIRLLYHPKVTLLRLAEREEAERRALGANERIDSAGSFLAMGELSRAELGKLSQVVAGANDDDAVENLAANGYVKNFMRFPQLDTLEQPRDIRTSTAYVNQYGDAVVEGAPRTVPVFPVSQQTASGVGFHFNTSAFDRHPRSHLFFVHNPIAQLALQCLKNASMYVDPDFPPSEYSAFGPEALDPDFQRGRVSWRRLSEIYFRPRLTTLGSKAVACSAGRFAPPWLIEMLAALQMTVEIEDIVSPGDDGWVYGVYVVRVCVEGRWAFVAVDDFVPCDPGTGNPICLSNSSEILWCILEKVLAKLEGSYRALEVRRPAFTLPRAWEDFTSNPTEVIEHEHINSRDDVCSNLCDMVLEEFNSCCVVARVSEGDRYLGFGAETGALWYVDSVNEYVPPGHVNGVFHFHVVRRAESRAQPKKIDQIREQLIEDLGPDAAAQLPDVAPAEVSYWMSSAEYFAMFDRTYVLRIFNNFQKGSIGVSFRGRENVGLKSAGLKYLLNNPQVLVSFMQPTDCVVELQLSDRRIPSLTAWDAPGLQLHMIKGHAAERPWSLEKDGDPAFVASTPIIDLRDDEEWRNYPEVQLRLHLPAGNYILCPTVGATSNETCFIKVFSASAFYLKLLN